MLHQDVLTDPAQHGAQCPSSHGLCVALRAKVHSLQQDPRRPSKIQIAVPFRTLLWSPREPTGLLTQGAGKAVPATLGILAEGSKSWSGVVYKWEPIWSILGNKGKTKLVGNLSSKSFEKSVDGALLLLRAGSVDCPFQNAPIEPLNQRASFFNNHDDL